MPPFIFKKANPVFNISEDFNASILQHVNEYRALSNLSAPPRSRVYNLPPATLIFRSEIYGN